MKNISKQAVVLDNFSSPYIHQAIIILKEYNPALEDKIIEEAEKVVSEYLKKPSVAYKKKRSKLSLIFLGVAVVMATALILSYII